MTAPFLDLSEKKRMISKLDPATGKTIFETLKLIGHQSVLQEVPDLTWLKSTIQGQKSNLALKS